MENGPAKPKIGVLVILCEIFNCRRVNCNEMDGDRPRQPANRNCYRLSRISLALARISCLVPKTNVFHGSSNINKFSYFLCQSEATNELNVFGSVSICQTD